MAELALDAVLEALLFTATEPLSIAQLAAAAGDVPAADVRAALEILEARLQAGIRLSAADGSYRLVTAPEAAKLVQNYLDDSQRQDLSRPAMETLAIVAYKGPLTKSQIEAIRGVSSEAMLRGLLGRGLITEAGRSSEPGRPQLYGVSHAFLQHFGLTSAKDLPPLPKTVPDED
jgi:segregation and condensation protein B